MLDWPVKVEQTWVVDGVAWILLSNGETWVQAFSLDNPDYVLVAQLPGMGQRDSARVGSEATTSEGPSDLSGSLGDSLPTPQADGDPGSQDPGLVSTTFPTIDPESGEPAMRLVFELKGVDHVRVNGWSGNRDRAIFLTLGNPFVYIDPPAINEDLELTFHREDGLQIGHLELPSRGRW